jgi:hypothetical protein
MHKRRSLYHGVPVDKAIPKTLDETVKAGRSFAARSPKAARKLVKHTFDGKV